MKQELEQNLYQKYPKIFSEVNLPPTETCMCWGFEHGDGWYNILDTLCANIQHYIDWKNRDGELVPQVVAEQVKEKFGSLRFYYRGGDEYIHGMISMAEAMSSVTCEECGAPGVTRGVGWFYTSCDEHARHGD